MVGDYINIMKTTFDFNFDLYQAFNRMHAQKHKQREAVNNKNTSLQLFLILQFEKSLLTIKKINKKSSSIH